MNIVIDGKVLPIEEAGLSINNRGYTYGDGLFETIRVVNSKIMFWEAHYFRLMSSMRIMRMEIPSNFSPENLEKLILELIQANNLESKPVKIKFNV